MTKHEIPSKIKNDKIFQFLNKINNGINESVELYQSGKENAGDLAKSLMQYGKQVSTYISSLSKSQSEKLGVMTKYVNTVNPLFTKNQGVEVSEAQVKKLEASVINSINSSKNVSIAKNSGVEISIGR